MVEENLGLVGWVLKRYNFRHDLDDLYQEGVLGLIEACKKYDKNKGVKFSPYARHHINRAIVDHILQFSTPLSINPVVMSEALSVRRGEKQAKETWSRIPAALKAWDLKRVTPVEFTREICVYDGGSQGVENREFIEYLRQHIPHEQVWADVHGLNGECLTKREVGRRMGVSGERIRQLVARADEKVKEIVGGMRD